MSIFPMILLTLTTVPRVICELSAPSHSSNNFMVSLFLKKWASAAKTRMLTVVFDDYESDVALDVPHRLLAAFNISTRLVTLKHLVSLASADPRHSYQAIEPGGCVLLLFSDVDHLRDILSSPHLSSFWQPENVYVLQDRGRRSLGSFEDERFCKWAFEKLWRLRRVYKLVLLSGDKAIRHDPFRYAGSNVDHFCNPSCDWSCIKAKTNDFLMVNEPNATDISDFFEENARRSFEGYPLKVSIFKTPTMSMQDGKYGGIDHKYLEEICRMMNVTPILLNTKDSYGWEENGVFFGALGQLVYKYADVTFNQFFVKDYLTRQVEFTTAITSDKLCVLVPKAPPVPDYLMIVKMFTGGTWLLILTGQFVIAMIYTSLKGKVKRDEECTPDKADRGKWSHWKAAAGRRSSADQNHIPLGVPLEIVEKKQRAEMHGGYPLKSTRNTAKGQHSKRFERMVLSNLASISKYLTRVFLQLMQPFERSQPWFPERLLLMCSLCLSLILNGVFTSQLASTFSKRMYYEDIDSLEQLEESGLAILTNSRDIIEDALTDATSPVLKRLHGRMKYANDSEIYRRLFVTKDAGCLQQLSALPFKYDEREIQKLHVVKECPKDYVLANAMTKGSPFRGRINSILDRLNNGGFYSKWYKSMFQSRKRVHQDSKSTTHRRITMRHLFIPFAILHVGLATSAVVFIRERRQNSLR